MQTLRDISKIDEKITLYDAAIEQGDDSAMTEQANNYLYGWEGPNHPDAIKLYEDAIKLGNTNAIYKRALMHRMGLGGEVNYIEAIRLYEEAIKKDDSARKYLNAVETQQKSHQKFINAIAVLEQKKEDFKKRVDYERNPKLIEAHDAADKLYKALKTEGDAYFSAGKMWYPNRDMIKISYITKSLYSGGVDCDTFKHNCKKHIGDASEVLGQHRGWTKILVNVSAFFLLGIIYIPAACINIALNRATFFTTDSSEKLSEIAEYVDNMRPPSSNRRARRSAF